MMGVWKCLLLSLLAVSACVHGVTGNILNVCQVQCRHEERLKAACRRERNCNSLLPDFDAFLMCLAPCSNIGNNCFQRCAFKTDQISSTCLRQCNIDQAPPSGAILSPADVNGNGVISSQSETQSGMLCYKTCYDDMLNAAMNRLYRKRPGSG